MESKICDTQILEWVNDDGKERIKRNRLTRKVIKIARTDQ
jgi:hypothetical protein